MNCDEAEELLGAYALEALPDEEASSMRAHLASCADHAARATELRGVALQLPSLADPIAAPSALRGRVLDAIRQQSAADLSATRRVDDAGARQTEARVQWRPTNIRAFPPAWGAIAAALVIAIGALLAWNVVLQNRDGSSVERLAARATTASALRQASGGVGGTVVYFGQDKKALVISEALPPLDNSKTYQMWAFDGARSTSIGIMNAGPGGAITAVVPFDASRAGKLAITIEPAGGSVQPTTAPILTASICINAPSSGCAT